MITFEALQAKFLETIRKQRNYYSRIGNDKFIHNEQEFNRLEEEAEELQNKMVKEQKKEMLRQFNEEGKPLRKYDDMGKKFNWGRLKDADMLSDKYYILKKK